MGQDGREYVDGGIYVEETGSTGSYIGGRGGAGNATKGDGSSPDHREVTPEDSIHTAPGPDEGFSTGRGGTGNVHVPHSKLSEPGNVTTSADIGEDGHLKKSTSHLGLADKLKFAMFGGPKK